MNESKWSGGGNRRKELSESCKGYRKVENHDGLRPERTCGHKKKRRMRLSRF